MFTGNIQSISRNMPMFSALLCFLCFGTDQFYLQTSRLLQWHWGNHVILRDHSGYGLSQREIMLQCNMVYHWLSPYPLWSLDPWRIWVNSSHGFDVNILRLRQNGRHFPDNIFNCIFLNENVSISITISLKFVTKGLINYIPALVQIMAWRRPGYKPISEPLMVRLSSHICITQPQWFNWCNHNKQTNHVHILANTPNFRNSEICNRHW